MVSRRDNKISQLIIGLISLVIFTQCAIPNGSLSGGEKDTQPPIIDIKKKNTKNYQTFFSEDKITLYFDEYVQLNNPHTNIIISPYLETPLKFKLTGKKLEISLNKEELEQNTTYILNLGNGIKDITEQNETRDYKFVFSTGEKIDSLQLVGQVTDYHTRGKVKNCKVNLYRGKDTIDINKTKPLYSSYTDEYGNFIFTNLKQSDYQILSYLDSNKNNKYSKGIDKISLIQTAKPAEKMVHLRLIDESLDLLLESYDCNKNHCIYEFNQQVAYKDITINGAAIKHYLEQDKALHIWSDTITAHELYIGKDTTKVTNLTSLKKEKVNVITFNNLAYPIRNKLPSSENIALTLNNYIKSVAAVTINDKKVNFELDKTTVRIKQEIKSKEKYKIALKDVALLNEAKTDSVSIIATVRDELFVGSIKLDVPTEEVNKPYTLYNDQVEITEGILPKTLLLENLNEGNYTIVVLNDTDGNGTYTPGDYELLRLPETTKRSKSFEIKAQWDLEKELEFIGN